ncbi:ABC transporter ATP-binding protein [Ostreibacterium oceani]|nr:ABC transporter ATP-binding protein [Ostreibacterium oceani]
MNETMRTENKTPVVMAKQIDYAYGEKHQRVEVLQCLDLTVFAGESVAIVGASGSGKSTLLHVLGGLDKPQSGEVLVCNQCLVKASGRSPNAKQQGEIRNQHLGFVYQFHHLLPEFSALENVMMPLFVRGITPREAKAAAMPLLEKVGVASRAAHKPAELSGGERQRVAIARAMVTNPDCLLADEPTGNLDQENAAAVMDLLFTLQRSENTALIIVTHDYAIADRMEKTYTLTDKRLQLSENPLVTSAGQ